LVRNVRQGFSLRDKERGIEKGILVFLDDYFNNKVQVESSKNLFLTIGKNYS